MPLTAILIALGHLVPPPLRKRKDLLLTSNPPGQVIKRPTLDAEARL